MALRVWLPLNGNLENQGLSTLVSTGTPTFLDNGKIGKCISLTPRVSFTGMPRMDNFTILFWLKVDSCTSDWADSLSFTSIQADGSSASPFRFEATKTTRACSFHNNSPYAITTGSRVLITEEQKGQWHHCGFSYDGEHCYTYIDGVLTYTDTGLGGYINNYFHIGETNNMVGGMNDLRIYDECLSSKQIKEISKGLVAHYKLEDIVANENLILRSDKITGGSQASGITRTYMSDGSTKFVAVSGNGNYASISFAEDSKTNVGNKLSAGDTYTMSCDILVEEGTKYPDIFINNTNGYKTLEGPTLKTGVWQRVYYTKTWNDPGTSTYGNISLHIGFSSAIGTYYFKNFKLEKGNLTQWTPALTDPMYKALGYNNVLTSDCSGNGYNLSMTGNLTYNEDSLRYLSSTKFGGTCADYLYRPIFDFLTSPFTFNCWAYQTSATSPSSGNTGNTLQMIAGQGRDCGLAGFELCSANGYARLYLGTQTNGTYYTINDNTINLLNNWHMITGIFDGTIAKLYVDGVLKGTKESPIEPSWDQATGFVIGKMSYYYSSQSTAYFPFAGSISDVKIYATALSAEDILTMYKTSGIIDNKNNVYAYEFKEE